MAKKFILGTLLALGAFVLIAPQCHAQSFDQYGGNTALSCTPGGTAPNTYYSVVKIGARWYFCTPAGHVQFSTQTNLNTVNNPASAGGGYDCQTNTFNSTGAPLTWTVYSGSIYQATVNWPVYAVFQDGIGMTGNTGSALTKESSLAALTAAGEWFYDGGSTLYVWTKSSDSPANHTTMNYPENTYSILQTKYVDPKYDWAWQVEKRMKAWGFNGVGQDSIVLPDTTCAGCDWPGGVNPIKMPYMFVDRPVQYSSFNQSNYASASVKSISAGDNSSYGTTFKNWTVDAFDPNFATFWNKKVTTDTDLINGYAYLQGFFTDDSDQFWGSGCGPDFLCGGQNNPNLAWMTMVSSPLQVYEPTPAQGSTPQLYPAANNAAYSKTQATNPAHGTCSISNPCSLRDALYDEYSGSISSLNAAWGSNYTSFDSTSTRVTGETISSAGTATTYTYTLTHTPVDPLSVAIYVGGVQKAGDCPSWHVPTCHVSSAAGSGSIESPTTGYLTSASNVNYSTGVVTLVFASAPNAAIAVNYACCGWMQGGTGLVDESGASAWIGSNKFCLEGPDPNYPSSYACASSGGNYKGVPSLSANGSITVNGGTATFTAASIPAAFKSGISVYINNTSGLCDVGPVTIASVTTTTFTFPSAGCSAAGSSWANTAVAHDLDAWVAQFSAEYHKVIRAGLNAATNPNLASDIKIPWLGMDDTGSWYSPAYSKFLQGAFPYVDGIETTFRADLPTVADAAKAYQYITRYFGDKPFLLQAQNFAQPDSPLSCKPLTQYAVDTTQAQRGSSYYDTVNFLLNTVGYNGTFPFIGMDFWFWTDIQNINQGLVSIHDNAYDGVEAISGTQACESSYIVNAGATCGKEPANFGNAITGANGVQAANALWLSIISPNAPNSQFKNNGNKGKVHQ